MIWVVVAGFAALFATLIYLRKEYTSTDWESIEDFQKMQDILGYESERRE